MMLPGPPLPQVHLQPGELLVTREPKWVITLLGSCVAVTMHNPRSRLAAICHAMLPAPHGSRAGADKPAECFRFLSHAIPAMLEPFHHAGLQAKEVEVKVFGGGNVIDLGAGLPHERLIGTANVAAARRLLHHAGLSICAENVGGGRGCKIVFNTHTGAVLHQCLTRRSLNPAGRQT